MTNGKVGTWRQAAGAAAALLMAMAVFVVGCSPGGTPETAPNSEAAPAAAAETNADAGAQVASARPAAAPRKGDPAPSFTATDINGNTVDLYEEIEERDDLMVILFFFTVDGGETICRKLRVLDALYGKGAPEQKVEIIGVGYREDSAELAAFATDLNIRYYLLDDAGDGVVASGYGPIQAIPFTYLIDRDKLILTTLRGGGESEARLLANIAENYLSKDPSVASRVADAAMGEGEDEKKAGEAKGLALVKLGNLDEARETYAAIESHGGQIRLALAEGDFDAASDLAERAPQDDPYAVVAAGNAKLALGDLENAGAVLEQVDAEGLPIYLAAEQLNALGRLAHAGGDLDGAMQQYAAAVASDKYAVEPLANKGAAQREKGDLEGAMSTLQTAQDRGGASDELVAMMLQQIQQELAERNDNERQERIRQRIRDLGEKFQAMKEAGNEEAHDDWSTRPMVVAFVPSREPMNAFFTRAGTELTVRREVQAGLRNDAGITVVDREFLDELLRELELSTSLGDPATQLQLGRLLAARQLVTADFAGAANDARLYLRMVDTETSELTGPFTLEMPPGKPLADVVDQAVQTVAGALGGREGPLKGLVAAAESPEEIYLNLGGAHGAEAGQVFAVVEEGEPMEVGGRTVPGKRDVVARVEITDVYDDYASIGRALSGADAIEPEMKVIEVEEE